MTTEASPLAASTGMAGPGRAGTTSSGNSRNDSDETTWHVKIRSWLVGAFTVSVTFISTPAVSIAAPTSAAGYTHTRRFRHRAMRCSQRRFFPFTSEAMELQVLRSEDQL